MDFHVSEYGGIRRAEIQRIEAKCAQREADIANQRIDTEQDGFLARTTSNTTIDSICTQDYEDFSAIPEIKLGERKEADIIEEEKELGLTPEDYADFRNC